MNLFIAVITLGLLSLFRPEYFECNVSIEDCNVYVFQEHDPNGVEGFYSITTSCPEGTSTTSGSGNNSISTWESILGEETCAYI